MSITPYQIVVPLLSIFVILYAWSLFGRQKKTLWEVLLWTLFWGALAGIALFPGTLGYLAAAIGIKSQVNAVFVTSIGILFFMMFYIIVRVEELEQRMTRIVRAIALREAGLKKEDTSDDLEHL